MHMCQKKAIVMSWQIVFNYNSEHIKIPSFWSAGYSLYFIRNHNDALWLLLQFKLLLFSNMWPAVMTPLKPFEFIVTLLSSWPTYIEHYWYQCFVSGHFKGNVYQTAMIKSRVSSLIMSVNLSWNLILTIIILTSGLSFIQVILTLIIVILVCIIIISFNNLFHHGTQLYFFIHLFLYEKGVGLFSEISLFDNLADVSVQKVKMFFLLVWLLCIHYMNWKRHGSRSSSWYSFIFERDTILLQFNVLYRTVCLVHVSFYTKRKACLK